VEASQIAQALDERGSGDKGLMFRRVKLGQGGKQPLLLRRAPLASRLDTFRRQ